MSQTFNTFIGDDISLKTSNVKITSMKVVI